jgi:hypothetical protein
MTYYLGIVVTAIVIFIAGYAALCWTLVTLAEMQA